VSLNSQEIRSILRDTKFYYNFLKETVTVLIQVGPDQALLICDPF